MNGVLAFLGRIPRPVLFGLAALIQVGLVAAMLFDRVSILWSGTEVVLKTRPVDPRDPLRGDYVVLTYEISTVPTDVLARQQVPLAAETPVYVKLAPGPDGFHHAVSLHRDRVPVQPDEVLIKGSATFSGICNSWSRSGCDTARVKYGLESYFVPEGEGRAIEHQRNDGKVTVVAVVTPSGRSAIKRLLVDGTVLYEEPLF